MGSNKISINGYESVQDYSGKELDRKSKVSDDNELNEKPKVFNSNKLNEKPKVFNSNKLNEKPEVLNSNKLNEKPEARDNNEGQKLHSGASAGWMDRKNVQNPSAVNTAALAFIGDAVYETYVRRYVYEKGILRPDRLSSTAVRYVRAEAQARILDRLQPDLYDEEAAIARRGKNHKITSMPHNVDPKMYRKATAFEAVVGYLDLKGDKERLKFLIERAFEIVESEDIKIDRRSADEKAR